MSGREDDGHAATKGDIRELWDGLHKELENERKAMKEYVDKEIELHDAKCPAADEQKRRQREGLIYGVGGLSIGSLTVTILLKVLEVI